MNPPPLSLASKFPVVAGREVACLPLTWLDILLEKSLCLGSNAKVTAPYDRTQSVVSIPRKGSQKGAEWTNLALPSPTSFRWSWEWDLADVSHRSATRSTWACWSRRLSSCSAGEWLLAELGNLLICLLQSLPPKLPVICQNFMHGRPLLNVFLSGQLGNQGPVIFPRPLYLCLRPPKFTPCSLPGEQIPCYLQGYCAMCPPPCWITSSSHFSLSLLPSAAVLSPSFLSVDSLHSLFISWM